MSGRKLTTLKNGEIKFNIIEESLNWMTFWFCKNWQNLPIFYDYYYKYCLFVEFRNCESLSVFIFGKRLTQNLENVLYWNLRIGDLPRNTPESFVSSRAW